ncbi:MAG: LysM peptidoglycan-binding domain-containing protein [Deltaproteobacteria bacterium]|jgi:trehalose synthase|nr:LysM peptidoglycan-binding domain-containing protein [Deltaproteobacteria bacterium]
MAAAPPKIPTRNSTTVAQLKRSDPGYLQYLESKSLLGSSRDLARIVSGSQIMWNAPATDPTPERLLRAASTWLGVHPIPLLTRSQEPVFGHLAGPVFQNIMRQIGIEGLYVSPGSGTGALWHSTRRRITAWEGMTQLAFTDDVGDDRDYGLLLGRANQSRFFLGLEMTQAATGLGPDFFLGARGNAEFQRLYRMLEIPQQFWADLPESAEEWDCKALSAEQVKKLAAEKVLPAGEDPHAIPCGAPWGWAVTGAVLTGERGNPRRFAYRYYLNPLRPIMDWEDPQAGARRILSACAIRRIGTQGAALLGMQTRALHGLNPGAKPNEANPEPALSAAVAIGREVRRYGAWTWLEDELSLPQMQAFLRNGPDFAFDAVGSPGAEHALLTGNAELVRFMYDEARRIGLDQRRLVRRLPDERGLSYALPHLCFLANVPGPLTPAQIREQARLSGGAWAGSTLYAGSAGLAALALHEDSSTPAAQAAIRRGQTLLLFFKAMQPGIFLLPARDLRGALPLDGKQGRRRPPDNEPALAAHGAYNLLSTADDAPAGKGGLPRAAVLYPPLDVQTMQPAGSFLQSVGDMLRVRKQTGIAAGRLVARLPTKNPGSIALLFALPGNQGAVLTLCNFSRSGSQENLNLGAPEVQAFAKGGVRPLWGAATDAASVQLGPWQGVAFLLGKMPEKNAGASPARPATSGSAPGTTDAPLNAPETAAPESPYVPGVQRLQREETSHLVRAGDRLHAIAALYKVSPEAIMARNNIPSPELVVEGRTLIIPAPATAPVLTAASAGRTEKSDAAPLQKGEQRHTVHNGDSLPKIAAQYNVHPEAIMQRNNLASPDRIHMGDALIIPAPATAPLLTAASAGRTEKSDAAPLRKGEQRHTAQSGDSLARLAAQYNVRPEAIMQRNKLSSPDLVRPGDALIIPAPDAYPVLAAASAGRREKSDAAPLQKGEQRHTVQSRDSLGRIAAQYNVRPEAIMQRNKLSSPDLVRLGDALIIPAPGAAPVLTAASAGRTEKADAAPLQKGEQRHTVQSGDSLGRIAAQYNVRPDAIMQRNKLSSPDLVRLGDALIIPAPAR